jgi:3-dehydroquinate synthase
VPEKSFHTTNYLVTDEIVDQHYGDSVLKSLRASGLEVTKLIVPSSSLDDTGDPSTEKFKTLNVFSSLCNEIIAKGMTKNTTIISLGGGVINNICGFLASSLYRGINLVHITTTMMGMVDAAIDFKQAVNHQLGKNLLGCYYGAAAIIIDPEMLVTTSERAIRNGLAEAVKHGLCHSLPLLQEILGCTDLKDVKWLTSVIQQTIALKSPTLTHYNDSDFNEMCPQYGHAVGHSAEFLSFHTGGTALLHGEGVSIGCCITAEIALIMGLCDQACVDMHYQIFRGCGLPVFLPSEMDEEEVCKQMLYDKHYELKRVTMGLLNKVGEMHSVDGAFTCIVEPDILSQAININISKREEGEEHKKLSAKDRNASCQSLCSELDELTSEIEEAGGSSDGESDDELADTPKRMPLFAGSAGIKGL